LSSRALACARWHSSDPSPRSVGGTVAVATVSCVAFVLRRNLNRRDCFPTKHECPPRCPVRVTYQPLSLAAPNADPIRQGLLSPNQSVAISVSISPDPTICNTLLACRAAAHNATGLSHIEASPLGFNGIRASGCLSSQPLLRPHPHVQQPPASSHQHAAGSQASNSQLHVLPCVKMEDARPCTASEDVLIQLAERQLLEVEEHARLHKDAHQAAVSSSKDPPATSPPTWSGTGLEDQHRPPPGPANALDRCNSESYRLPSFSRTPPKFIKHDAHLHTPPVAGAAALR
jgi:hypothetical protein